MKKRIIIGFVVLVLLVLALCWNHWQAGQIMSRARNTDRHFFNEIIVRKVPMNRNPIAMFLSFLPTDDYYTQCEFHRPNGNGRPWSYQTFTGESYTPSKARIQWTAENEAIVFLDDNPTFKCVNGWWMKAK